MKLTFRCFLFLLFHYPYFAPAAEIRGIVLSADRSPLEFANVVLLQAKDSSLVKGDITNSEGRFQLENINTGTYLLMISQLGYAKNYSGPLQVNTTDEILSLPAVVLSEKLVLLKSAEVTALRPFIERQVDKTVVNIENSLVDAGATALEILKRAPGVIVDNDGNITIKGRQGVQVLIDGKPTYLSAPDLYNRLRNMTSDELSQIEIISNPSARYDAAGNSGIINLKMRKKINIGLNGTVTLSYGQGRYPDFGSGTTINFRNPRWNVFGNYHYMYGYYFEATDLDRRFSDQDHVSQFRQHIFDKGRYINHNFRGGLDYFLNDKQTIGLQVRGYNSSGRDRNTSTTEIYNLNEQADSGYVTRNANDSKWENLSANLNYQYRIDTAGRELTADLDYGIYSNRSDFVFTTEHFYSDPSRSAPVDLATNDQPAEIKIFSFKTDYVHPLSKDLKLEAGWKSSLVETDNDVRYLNYYNGIGIADTGKSNHFEYKENINAAYLNLNRKWNQFSVQTGIRMEQTLAEGRQRTTGEDFKRDYLQLFPSVFMSYAFNDKHESRISYSRRIDRPAYQQLNPFRYFLDPYNYMEGNPSLQPQLTHSFEAGHTFYKLVTLTLNYSNTRDAMTQITQQVDSTRTTFVRTENLNTNESYGLGISVPVQLFSWWYSSNNLNTFNNRFTGRSSVGELDKQLWSVAFNTYNSFSLGKSWSAELSAYYNSRMVWGTWLVEPKVVASAGFRKTFQGDRFDLRINVNDIFHSEKMNSSIVYQNIDASFKRVFDSRFIRLHLSYNFGKKSVSSKRQRDSGSREEENRIQQGR